MSNWFGVTLLAFATSLSPSLVRAEDEPKSKVEKQLT